MNSGYLLGQPQSLLRLNIPSIFLDLGFLYPLNFFFFLPKSSVFMASGLAFAGVIAVTLRVNAKSRRKETLFFITDLGRQDEFIDT